MVPIEVGGRRLGAMLLGTQRPNQRQFTADEGDLALAMANQAGLAIESARLYEQAQQVAALEERQRLARDLHDSATQSLYGVTMFAEAAARLLKSGEIELAIDHLGEVRDTALEALREMRLLIFELRPPILEKEGLVTALQTRLEMVEGRSGLETEFKAERVDDLPSEIEEGLYRIAQEVLNNILKHAQAHQVTVHLCRDQHKVILEITDDGIGFDPTTNREKGGLGLAGMEERVALLGGQLIVNSKPGEGTTRAGGGILMANSIRVLVVDDHAIVRKGIRALLATEPDIEMVGEATNGKEAISQTESLQPDVILMDLVMPEVDGIEAIRRITARQPEARILVLTSFATNEKVFPAIKAGALGYLLKDSEPEVLVQAIRQAHRGESSLHPTIARKLLEETITRFRARTHIQAVDRPRGGSAAVGGAGTE